MNVLLVMPTMRHGYWPAVRRHMEQAMAACPDLKLFWMPVLYDTEVSALTPEQAEPVFGHFTPRWIKPLIVTEQPNLGVQNITLKLNLANDEYERTGFNGWVSWWSDDNLLPRNIGRHLVAHRDKPAIVFSHKRGQRVAGPLPYGIDDLIAGPEHMQVGRVSGEQYFIHTRLIPKWRFPYNLCGDGLLIKALNETVPDQIAFVPEFYTPFNALEPGRWDAEELEKVIEQA